MHSPTALAFNHNKKSDIKFIRNVAAPKKSPSFKVQSAANILYPSSPTILPAPFSLLLNLTLPDRTQQSLLFNYNEQARVRELIQFVKSQIRMQYVCLKTGNMMIDYFLTLEDRMLVELTVSKLQIAVERVEVAK